MQADRVRRAPLRRTGPAAGYASNHRKLMDPFFVIGTLPCAGPCKLHGQRRELCRKNRGAGLDLDGPGRGLPGGGSDRCAGGTAMRGGPTRGSSREVGGEMRRSSPEGTARALRGPARAAAPSAGWAVWRLGNRRCRRTGRGDRQRTRAPCGWRTAPARFPLSVGRSPRFPTAGPALAGNGGRRTERHLGVRKPQWELARRSAC